MRECLPERVGVAAEVEDAPDDGKVIIKAVVHGLGETLRQETMEAKDLRMNACVEDQ